VHRFGTLAAGLAVTGLLVACAGNPKPGDPGYRYNVAGNYTASFNVDGVPYGGIITLDTAPGGAVSGRMALVTPLPIESELTGTVSADSLRLSIPYTLPDGCNGTAVLRGPIAEGGGSASGAMEVNDSCAGLLTGTFTLTR
jgi:hypothetical protein